jgi:surface protein
LFLPLLIVILIISIIVYFIIKPIKDKNARSKNENDNLINYTIIEKIAVTKNDSKPIQLFNDYFTKIKNNVISFKINNTTIDEIDNFYKFSKIGNYHVEITFNKKLETMQEIFNYCFDIVELDLSGIDTSQVTSMKYAFHGCHKLKNIIFENFNTSSVTDMSYMFSECHSLKSLNLHHFNTSLVQDLSFMFDNSSKLEYVNVSSFNTKNVFKMQYMFHLCNLTSLHVANFNTEKVNYLQYMFSSCGRLTSLDLGNFKTEEVVDFSCLFKGNKFLKKINISNFNTTRMNSYNDIFSNLPENGIITVNIKKTSALLLNQIPKAWKIVKIDNIKFFYHKRIKYINDKILF